MRAKLNEQRNSALPLSETKALKLLTTTLEIELLDRLTHALVCVCV